MSAGSGGRLEVTVKAGGQRPWTRLGVAALAGHVFYELGAGVGMPLASVVGPAPAAGLWAAGTAGTWRAAATRPASADTALTVVNAVGLAAVAGHLAGWPRRRTRAGLPVLTECEGLGPELMPAYNAILYTSAVAVTIALTTENRTAPGRARLVALALVLAPALAAAQHAEHRRLQRRAAQRPAWWNRRLPPGTGAARG